MTEELRMILPCFVWKKIPQRTNGRITQWRHANTIMKAYFLGLPKFIAVKTGHSADEELRAIAQKSLKRSKISLHTYRNLDAYFCSRNQKKAEKE